MVSVIIPIYNSGNTIKKCIDSILNQDYEDFELILVNDGSTDNSRNIIEEYFKKNNKISLFNIENSGRSYARNLGLEKAKGNYILFVDSDDYIKPNLLTRCMEEIKEDDVIIYGYELKRYYTKTIIVNEDKNISINSINNIFSKEDIPLIYYHDLFNGPCNKIYKKSIIDENKITFENKIWLGEDLLFNLEYFKYVNTTFKCLKDNLYIYNVKENVFNSICYDDYIETQEFLFINIINTMEKYYNIPKEKYKLIYLKRIYINNNIYFRTLKEHDSNLTTRYKKIKNLMEEHNDIIYLNKINKSILIKIMKLLYAKFPVSYIFFCKVYKVIHGI